MRGFDHNLLLGRSELAITKFFKCELNDPRLQQDMSSVAMGIEQFRHAEYSQGRSDAAGTNNGSQNDECWFSDNLLVLCFV